MGMKIPFKNSKNLANFTEFLKFIRKNRNNCILGYYFFSAYFLKRCQKCQQRTSVGEYFGKDVGRQKYWKDYFKKTQSLTYCTRRQIFFCIFFQIRGKVFGRTSVGANLIRTSVGRNFKGILAQKTIFFKSVRNFGDD